MPKKFCLNYQKELKDSSLSSQEKFNFSFVLSLSLIWFLLDFISVFIVFLLTFIFSVNCIKKA